MSTLEIVLISLIFIQFGYIVFIDMRERNNKKQRKKTFIDIYGRIRSLTEGFEFDPKVNVEVKIAGEELDDAVTNAMEARRVEE